MLHRSGNTAHPGAFTLLELLVVIAIIGILAAIAMPVLNSFKPDISGVASRQMLDAVARARQLALSQRTTVYMVFVPTNFYNTPFYNALPQAEKDKADKLLDKQLIGYNFVTLRSVGDQPGRPTPRYWSDWKTLPQGAFIGLEKFAPRNAMNPIPVLAISTNDATGNKFFAYNVYGFRMTNNIPWPSENTPAGPGGTYLYLPYIAFDYTGQLASSADEPNPRDECIPLTRGNVSFARSQSPTTLLRAAPTVRENVPGDITNNYNVVRIDWLTGKARVEHPEFQ